MSQVHAEFPLESGTAADKARDETLDRQWWAAGPRRAVVGMATARAGAPAPVRLPPRTPVRAPLPLPAPDAGAPSGWYPEPPKLRYWDGERWTEDTRFARPPVAGTRVGISVLVSAPAAAGPAVPAAPPAAVAPVPEAPRVEPSVTQPQEADRGVMHELAVFLLVAMVALTVGAIVAALGIAFTS